MESFLTRYFSEFREALDKIAVTDQDKRPMAYDRALGEVCALVDEVKAAGRKIMMVGNGGSAGICSHQAVDYWKNGGIKAMAFNDSSLLTCISNDFSYAEVFSKPVEMFAEEGDLLFCISSSGRSENILNAAHAARKALCRVVTFSGFAENNPLRQEGIFNFYVSGFSYGFVEIIHLFIIHSILDAHLYERQDVDVFNKNQPKKGRPERT